MDLTWILVFGLIVILIFYVIEKTPLPGDTAWWVRLVVGVIVIVILISVLLGVAPPRLR